MSRWEKKQLASKYCKEGILPRVLWVPKELTLYLLHLEVFKTLRFLLAEWVDYKDPDTKKKVTSKYDLTKTLPAFPYKPEGWEENKCFTRADFDGMGLEA